MGDAPQDHLERPDLQDWLVRCRLDALAHVFEGEPTGEAIERHRHRDVWRLDGEAGQALYVKRYHRRHFKDRWPDWRRGRPARSDAAVERAAFEAFAAAGLETVPVVAWGESADPERGSYLITLGEPGWSGLDAWILERAAQASPRDRRRLAAALGAEIGRLHGSGLGHPDLLAWHVLVPDELDAEIRFRHLDLLRATQAPSSRRRRARDLAALVASVPMLKIDRRLRWVFLRAYERVVGGASERRALLRHIRVRLEQIEDRPKFQRSRWGEWRSTDGARVRWRRELAAVPKAPNLDRLEEVEGITVQRRLSERTNAVWVDPVPGETWYLKVHRARDGSGRRRAKREWKRLMALEWEGVSAARVVGWGREPRRGWVLTRQVPGAPVDELLMSDWPGSARRLVEEADRLGCFVRHFHRLGHYHKDLYLCHVFATAAESGPIRYTLIDAGRIERGERVRPRWFVKDLAALASSWPAESPAGGRRGAPPRRVVAAFLRAYGGPSAPGRRELLRAVRRKVRRILSHVPKNQRLSPSGAPRSQRP